LIGGEPGGGTTKALGLSVEDLWFRYPGKDWIIKGLNLAVEPGRAVLIMGRSGSGKTTLLRAIVGTGTSIYGGEIRGAVRVDGVDVSELPPREAARFTQLVPQNPYTSFIEHLLEDDLSGYAESIHGSRWREFFERAVISLQVEHLLERLFFELSGGEARRAAAAKALIPQPRVLLFDEPLMWLDDRGVEMFRELVRVLKSIDRSLVIAEHRYLPLLDVVDSVYLLEDGVLKPLDPSQLKPRGVKTPIDERRRGGKPGGSDQPVLRLRDVWYTYSGDRWILRGVSMEVPEGSSVVVYGLNGSGKTTLLRVSSGILKPKRGKVELAGRAVYVPQNVNLFFTEETVLREVEAVCRAAKGGRRCVEEALSTARRLGLGVSPDESPHNLSWGEKMRLAILLAAASGARLVILDEPFTGLTYYERFVVAELLESIPAAKLIAVSELSQAALVKGAEALHLFDGVLRRIEIPNALRIEVEAVAESSAKIYGYEVQQPWL